jgi:hypothetical protein
MSPTSATNSIAATSRVELIMRVSNMGEFEDSADLEIFDPESDPDGLNRDKPNRSDTVFMEDITTQEDPFTTLMGPS